MTLQPGIRVVSDLSSLGEERWDELESPAGFYQSYRWLRTVEQSAANGSVSYLLAELDNTLVGALPVYCYPKPTANPLYDLPRLFSPLLQQPSSGSLIGGSAAGYANAVPIRRQLGEDDAAKTVAALLDGFTELAGEVAECVAALPYLTQAAARALDAAPAPNRLVRCGAEVSLEIAWETFDGYLTSLSSKRRSTVKRDLRTLSESHAEFSTSRLSDALDEVPALLHVVQEQHGVQSNPLAIRANLSRCITEGLDSHSVVFSCRSRGDLTAACIAYEWRGTLYLRSVGMAPSPPPGAYFGVTFYAPIRYAIEHRLQRVHLGTQSLRPKMLRGGHLSPLWSLLVGCNSAPVAITRWNERLEREMEAELGRLSRVPPTARAALR